LHWWSLPEDELNFWWIFVPSSLFIIPIFFSDAAAPSTVQAWGVQEKREADTAPDEFTAG
jgi:hypothetical protein